MMVVDGVDGVDGVDAILRHTYLQYYAVANNFILFCSLCCLYVWM